jgi:hypothetical protein
MWMMEKNIRKRKQYLKERLVSTYLPTYLPSNIVLSGTTHLSTLVSTETAYLYEY